MNKQELFKKALEEFDEWPYPFAKSLICCLKSHGGYKVGDFEMCGYREEVDLQDSWLFVCTKEEFEKAKEDQDYKPAIGERCEAKVQCVSHHCWVKGEILKRKDNGITCAVLLDEDLNGSNLHWANEFKPIDDRTDEEKCIDTLTEYFEYAVSREDSVHPSIFSEGLFGDIKDGLVSGLKWVG